MTSSKVFKLSSIAATILAATTANAALYNIVEVTPQFSSDEYSHVYGVAIQPAAMGSNDLGCFGSDCSDSAFKLAGETRNTVDGVSYREEAPFAMDRSFRYIQEYDDFKRYCYNELLYSTCETWANEHWNAWNTELKGSTTSNALAFVEDDANAYENKYNNVINSLDSDGKPVGNRSIAGGTRNEIVSPIVQDGSADNGDWKQGRAWAVDSTGVFSVGSIARTATNDQGEHHTSKAAIWRAEEAPVELNWPSNQSKDGELLAQGSMRDIAIADTGAIHAVGYNTYGDDNYYDASIFVSTTGYSSASDWTTIKINGAQSRIDGDTIHSNSVASSINNNLLVVGSAKRSGYYPQNGAAGNLLFISNASESPPNATFLQNISGSRNLFFSGAGGKVGAVNNFNEIVGQVDADEARENKGKPRRKRGFIYPHNFEGTVPERSAIFANKAQYLDNLTNDDVVTGTDVNNQYRIIDATDINDAGVISATAIKCSGGYDNTTHNSYCGSGSKTEETVAVKLIPINGADNSNIINRGIEEPIVERKGGSIGWAMFALLGLLGFRRK